MSSREHELLASGPTATLDAIQKGESGLDLHVLAQACGRAARAALDLDTALAWTDAAVAAYAGEAATLSNRLARNGREIVAFGLRASMVLRPGVESARVTRYLAETERWLFEAVQDLDGPDELYTLSIPGTTNRARVLIALERLRAVAGLWDQGLLADRLGPWFRALAGVQDGARRG